MGHRGPGAGKLRLPPMKNSFKRKTDPTSSIKKKKRKRQCIMSSPLKGVVRKANKNKFRSRTSNTLAYSITNDRKSNIQTIDFQIEERNLKLQKAPEENHESQVSRSYFHASEKQLTILKNSSKTMTFGKGSEETGFMRDMSRKGSGKKNKAIREVNETESQDVIDTERLLKKKAPNVVQSEVIKKTHSNQYGNDSERPINFESFEPGNGGVIDKIEEDESKNVSDVSRPRLQKRFEENDSQAQSSVIDPIFRGSGDELESGLIAKMNNEDHKCLDDFQMMKNIWKQHQIVKNKKSYDAVVL